MSDLPTFIALCPNCAESSRHDVMKLFTEITRLSTEHSVMVAALQVIFRFPHPEAEVKETARNALDSVSGTQK